MAEPLVRQVSSQRATTLRARGEIVRRAHSPQTCARHPSVYGHDAAAVDTHELVNRSQGDTAAAEEEMTPLCRPCHDWVGAHPAEAIAAGWQVPGWQRRLTIAQDLLNIETDVKHMSMPDDEAEDAGKGRTEFIGFRTTAAGKAAIERRAAAAGKGVSAMVRDMVAYADQHDMRAAPTQRATLPASTRERRAVPKPGGKTK